MIFNCRHKFKHIVVYSDSSENTCKEHPNDFTIVTHHLYCTNCNQKLDLEYAKIKGHLLEVLTSINYSIKAENK